MLDIMLPGWDGLSLLRHLRERQNNTPVLLLLARDRLTTATVLLPIACLAPSTALN